MSVMFLIISIREVMGRGDLKFVFFRCVLSSLRHFLIGMLVYREDMSKLFMVLFLMSMFFSFCRRSPEFLMCAELIVPSRGVSSFVMAWAILCVALPIPEMMGRSGVFSLCVLGRPYSVGIFGWCSMRDVQVLLFLVSFLKRLLKASTSLFMVVMVVGV